jgi:hypothetical protein
MRHADGRLAIFGDHAHAGEIALLDARGRLVAQHRAPACAPR